MKLSQLIKNLPFGTKDVEVTNITNNSRDVKPGTMFVCIKGFSQDGHKYAFDAANKGASAVIVDHNVGLDCQVIVNDTRQAYAESCAAFFGNPAEKLKIIGVTGTNGKTTTTFLLKSLLELFGKKVGLIGTIQNMIGDKVVESSNTTPDAYQLHELFSQMVKENCEYCVMEVSSHALDQQRVAGINFEVGVFTNLTQDHLDYHRTMENYLQAKQKLFKMSKMAVINTDDKYSESIKSACTGKVVTYAVEDLKSDYLAKGINFRSDGTVFELVGSDVQISRVKIKTPGKFSVYNALCAAATAIALGFDFNSIAENLSKTTGVKGRAEVVPTDRDFTVIIDYAHTPDGLENILSSMNEIKKGRLICVFGCGGDRDATKRHIMGAISQRLADYSIVTSDNPRTENPSDIIKDIVKGFTSKAAYKVIENRKQAIKFAIDNAQTDDIIVLAGKGHETYQILGKEKVHFDEREIVADALK